MNGHSRQVNYKVLLSVVLEILVVMMRIEKVWLAQDNKIALGYVLLYHSTLKVVFLANVFMVKLISRELSVLIIRLTDLSYYKQENMIRIRQKSNFNMRWKLKAATSQQMFIRTKI